jgi:hypothetical protein
MKKAAGHNVLKKNVLNIVLTALGICSLFVLYLYPGDITGNVILGSSCISGRFYLFDSGIGHYNNIMKCENVDGVSVLKPCTGTVCQSPAVTATQPLTVITFGLGSGIISSAPFGLNCQTSSATTCTASFPSGSQVFLQAKPNLPMFTGSGSLFSGWSGGCAGKNPFVCAVTMDGSKTVTGSFMSYSESSIQIIVKNGAGTLLSKVLDSSPASKSICSFDEQRGIYECTVFPNSLDTPVVVPAGWAYVYATLKDARDPAGIIVPASSQVIASLEIEGTNRDGSKIILSNTNCMYNAICQKDFNFGPLLRELKIRVKVLDADAELPVAEDEKLPVMVEEVNTVIRGCPGCPFAGKYDPDYASRYQEIIFPGISPCGVLTHLGTSSEGVVCRLDLDIRDAQFTGDKYRITVNDSLKWNVWMFGINQGDTGSLCDFAAQECSREISVARRSDGTTDPGILHLYVRSVKKP